MNFSPSHSLTECTWVVDTCVLSQILLASPLIPATAAVTGSVQASTNFMQVPLNSASSTTQASHFLFGGFCESPHGDVHRSLFGTHACARLKGGTEGREE